MEYNIAGKYQQFKTQLICFDDYEWSPSFVEIYGDDALLYKSPNLTKSDKVFNIDLDVTGVSKLNFVFNNPDGESSYDSNRRFALAEPVLIK